MASEHAFFAHRLGHRDVDCENGSKLGDLAINLGADDEISLVGKCRQRRLAKQEDTWRSGCDISSLAQIRQTIPPPDHIPNPPPPPSHTHSTSCSSSASLLRGQRTNSQASLACQEPWHSLSGTRLTHRAHIQVAATLHPQNSTSSLQELIDSFCKPLTRPDIEDTGPNNPRSSCESQPFSDVALKAVD